MDRKMRKSKRSFYAVFNPKTDVRKSINNFRLAGFKVGGFGAYTKHTLFSSSEN